MLTKWLQRLSDLLHRPVTVLWICGFVALASVLFDGSFIHLWSLHRDHSRLETRIDDSKARLRQMKFKIQEAERPQFIERQARDQFDLVKEGDLIFIFPDESSENGG
jgi:cell division protein FtsB